MGKLLPEPGSVEAVEVFAAEEMSRDPPPCFWGNGPRTFHCHALHGALCVFLHMALFFLDQL